MIVNFFDSAEVEDFLEVSSVKSSLLSSFEALSDESENVAGRVTSFFDSLLPHVLLSRLPYLASFFRRMNSIYFWLFGLIPAKRWWLIEYSDDKDTTIVL